jgi:hypothetical protein
MDPVRALPPCESSVQLPLLLRLGHSPPHAPRRLAEHVHVYTEQCKRALSVSVNTKLLPRRDQIYTQVGFAPSNETAAA